MSARDDYPPASITSQWAEMCDAIDSLREQLARQAPVIEAAEVWLAAHDNELYAPAIDERLADAMNEYLTVRALSVPAPPEAPEPLKRVEDLLTVDEQAALRKDLAEMAAIRRRTAASDVVLGTAAPPTEEEAP